MRLLRAEGSGGATGDSVLGEVGLTRLREEVRPLRLTGDAGQTATTD